MSAFWNNYYCSNFSILTSAHPAQSIASRFAATGLLCLVIISIAACGDRTPPLKKLSANAVVVAFGNSLTYGTGAKDEETYPAQLESITGLQVINEGVPGEISAAGRKRLPAVLDEHQPELLILCHGGNDMLRKRSIQELTENLLAMIGEAQSRSIDVVLLGVPEPALFLLESAPVYKTVATRTEIPLEDDSLPEILSDNDLKSDGIHPNARGYRLLAESVAKLLKKTGAL